MLPSAYLTDKQLTIWSLRLKGFSKAEIGRRLGVTRQAIYDAEGVTLPKIEAALRHTADANMLETLYVSPEKGVLLGFSPAMKRRVIVTFSTRNGIQTWHHEEPNCPSCRWTGRCRKRLLMEAEERGVEISTEEEEMPPSRLAHLIFSRMIPGLNE